MIESYESYEDVNTRFELDSSQQQLIDNEVCQLEGGDLLLNGNIEENRDLVIDTYDKLLKTFRPDIKTAVNLSPMKTYSNSWDTFISNYLESPYLEAFSDREQVEMISDYMSNIEDIRLENWKDLSLEERLGVLNKMEQNIAHIEHRPAIPIYAEQMEHYGYQQHDPTDPSHDKIAINTRVIAESGDSQVMLDELLDTLIHEGRHRYQHYNIEDRLVHESQADVASWRENFEQLGYADGSPIHIVEIGPVGLFTNERLADLGFRLYYYQPVEVDARNFASDVINQYHNKLQA